MGNKRFIVCGYGKTGSRAAKSLANRYGAEINIIDTNPELSESAVSEGFYFFQGDSSLSNVLLEAGIKNSDGIICTFSDDDLNALCIITAKWLNPEISIITRAHSQHAVKKLKLAGASKVVLFPNRRSFFYRLASGPFNPELLISSLVNFEKEVCLSEIKASEYSFLKNKKLSIIRTISDVKIMALKKNNGIIYTRPAQNEIIGKEDIIVILSETEGIKYIHKTLKTLSLSEKLQKMAAFIFNKKSLVLWSALLIYFNYMVIFEDFMNWIVLPAPPFTVGHLMFAFSTFGFGVFFIILSRMLSSKYQL